MGARVYRAVTMYGMIEEHFETTYKKDKERLQC